MMKGGMGRWMNVGWRDRSLDNSKDDREIIEGGMEE